MKYKKILFSLILVFSFWLMPVKAAGIEEFYIKATIEPNGDMLVKEAFSVNGTYNGYDRIYSWDDSALPNFNPNASEFAESKIHSASQIEILKVGSMPKYLVNSLDSLTKEPVWFTESVSANVGDRNVYTLNKTSNSVSARIYNPSYTNNAFYVEYLVKDVVVLHADVAELGYTFLSQGLPDDIGHLEILIEIPNNENLLRSWAHGPLNGDVRILSNQEVVFGVNGFDGDDFLASRIVFDKEAITSASKKTDVSAFDKIVKYETRMAKEANLKREKEERKQVLIKNIINGIYLVILISFLYIIYFVYKKYDKEYQSDFKGKYYRDFPATYGPEILNYLLYKKIDNTALSAAILNLIAKGAIKVEKSVQGKANDYNLIYNSKYLPVGSEQKLLDFLFDEMKVPQVSLSEIKNMAFKDYDKFIKHYNAWSFEVNDEAVCQNFFEDSNAKIYICLYIILVLLLIFGLFISGAFSILGVIASVVGVIAIIYIFKAGKRSKQGNEDYRKWMGLKKFMEDFGRMDEKDLPEIILWEKYLVYAVVLGCADKLAKTMKIKMAEAYDMSSNRDFDLNTFDTMLDLNHILFHHMDRALNTAYSRSYQNSNHDDWPSSGSHGNMSSGGGFGGGFSSGGSFGGGSSGGRF